jgi:hypothetical protein
MNNHRKHIHLGTRLEVAESIRRGETTPEQAAQNLGVAPGEVRRWVASGERPVTFEEVLVSPEARRLTRRAERLVALIAQADATIRLLTHRLVGGKRATQGAD